MCPVLNSLVELRIITVLNKGLAMIIAADVPLFKWYRLFREESTTSIDLDTLVVIELEGEINSRIEHWCGDLPRLAYVLIVWGEAGVAKLKTKIAPKVLNKGVRCMFLGFTKNHEIDIYRL